MRAGGRNNIKALKQNSGVPAQYENMQICNICNHAGMQYMQKCSYAGGRRRSAGDLDNQPTVRTGVRTLSSWIPGWIVIMIVFLS